MSLLKNKIEKIELALNVNQIQRIINVMYYPDNTIGKFFKDKKERSKYIDWRDEIEKNKNPENQFIVYSFNEADVIKHIDDFRKECK